MHRLRPLLAIAFVPAALALVALLLSTISPWRQDGPVIRLQIGPDWERAAAFDSRALSCAEHERSGVNYGELRLRASCSLDVAGSPLAFDIAHQEGTTVGSCSATYAGAPVPCESIVAFYNSRLPSVSIASDLGLDPATLRSLPGTNPLFYISEDVWQWVGVACAAAISAGSLWIAGGRAPAPATLGGRAARAGLYLFSGGLLFAMLWYAMLFVTLSSGLVD